MTTKRYLTISSDGIETLWFDKPMKYYDGHGNFKWYCYYWEFWDGLPIYLYT